MSRKETEDWDSLRHSVEELLKLSDEISFIGLKKMVKIYTFDKLDDEINEKNSERRNEPFFTINSINLIISTITGVIGGIAANNLTQPIFGKYTLFFVFITAILLILLCLGLLSYIQRK
ncbi:MAG: hypothetical protein K8R08_00985 [Methanosarcinales archaeon]|nr:hypothetical protein [Methanosarcinales archaeon]